MVLCMAKEDFQRPSASEGLQLLEMLLPETSEEDCHCTFNNTRYSSSNKVSSTVPKAKKMAALQRFARGALSVSRTLRKTAATVWNEMSCIRGSDVKPFENLVPTNVPAIPSTYAAVSIDNTQANTPEPSGLQRKEKEKRSDVKPSARSPVLPDHSIQDNSESRRKKIIEESKTGSHKAVEVFLHQREEVQLNSGSNDKLPGEIS